MHVSFGFMTLVTMDGNVMLRDTTAAAYSLMHLVFWCRSLDCERGKEVHVIEFVLRLHARKVRIQSVFESGLLYSVFPFPNRTVG